VLRSLSSAPHRVCCTLCCAALPACASLILSIRFDHRPPSPLPRRDTAPIHRAETHLTAVPVSPRIAWDQASAIAPRRAHEWPTIRPRTQKSPGPQRAIRWEQQCSDTGPLSRFFLVFVQNTLPGRAACPHPFTAIPGPSSQTRPWRGSPRRPLPSSRRTHAPYTHTLSHTSPHLTSPRSTRALRMVYWPRP
jgi:hypothetical protein